MRASKRHDGVDNPANGRTNHRSPNDVMKRAEEENVMVYAVGFAGPNPSFGGGFGGGGHGGGWFGGRRGRSAFGGPPPEPRPSCKGRRDFLLQC